MVQLLATALHLAIFHKLEQLGTYQCLSAPACLVSFSSLSFSITVEIKYFQKVEYDNCEFYEKQQGHSQILEKLENHAISKHQYI